MFFTKQTFFFLFVAALFFTACRNNNSEHVIDETTETGKPGDTVQIVNTPDKFESMGVEDDKKVYTFVRRFKNALKRADTKAVAAMTTFPLRLNMQAGRKKSKHVFVKDEAELSEKYADIFTADLITQVINQDTTTLFANYQGLMLGDSGAMWAGLDSTGAIKLFSINVP